jgi:hypothetical protein
MQTVDIVGLSAALSTATLLIVQYLKPLIELIPGLTLDQNKLVHDRVFQGLQFLINLGLLLAAQAYIPGSPYAGYNIVQLVLVLLGQAGLSEFTYKKVSPGGTPGVQSGTGTGTTTTQTMAKTSPTSTPIVIPRSGIPEVPRQ